MADQDTPPPTITAMKIPIIKKGEYDIWSMRMRQYICHTDHNLWDIIVNGDLEDEATPSGEQSSPPVPKTAKQLAARRNQERIKSILLLAIPDEYLLKFHNVPDAKSLWAAIKSRFGGNEESKKMQKNVLKHQFENFVTASNETLDKAYDRFQKLISQLEIHGAYVSKEDINQKFLRSLPPSWRCIKDELKRYAMEILGPQLENEDFQQMDRDDLRKLTMHTQRISSQARGGSDGQGGYDWSNDFTSRTSQLCFECQLLFKLINFSDMRGYEIALESLEARILGHENNELAWGERYEFQNYDLLMTRMNDEDDVCAIKTVSSVEPNVTQAVRSQADKSGQNSQKQGIDFKKGNPKILLQDHAVVDNGCSSHMTRNKAYLSDYEYFNGGFVAFGSDPKGGTPQQNGVAERNYRTLIEAAITMLADHFLLVPIFAEAKFDRKSDEGYLLGYSSLYKAFKYTTKRNQMLEMNLHINFLEDQPNVAGTGTQDSYVAGSSGKDKGPTQEYILLPLQPHMTRFSEKDVVQNA
ncbi:hypothetical protein Tco_0453619 [Tanacetum coccineum]